MASVNKEDIYEQIVEGLETQITARDYESLHDLATTLSDYVYHVFALGEADAINYLKTPEINKKLHRYGLDADVVYKLSTASGVGASDEISAEVRKVAEQMRNTLRTDYDEQLGWPYYQDDTDLPKSNAKTVATCAYSLEKTNFFIYRTKSHPDTKKIKCAIDLLFSPGVLCSKNGKIGWDEQPFCAEKARDPVAMPSLITSAYVANIVIRTDPNTAHDVESVIETIIDSLDHINKNDDFPSRMRAWTIQDTGEIDIVGTCYALRAISTYLKFHQNRPSSRLDLDRLMDIKSWVRATLSLIQHPDGLWLDPVNGISHQSATALAIQALRSAGYTRNWSAVRKGCNWLLSRLDFIHQNWCWPEKNKDGKIQESVQDSALCLSALLRGTTIGEFSKAEAVLLWLVKEMKAKSLKGSIYPATVLCAFVDYLRAIAFKDPHFFDS